MNHHGTVDYAKMTKSGFALGLALFVIGAVGGILGHTILSPIPDWENTLFLYSEGIGILVGFFSIWIFGVFLPLVK
ncbi:DUF7860 family protein [Halovenus marina]|jgi:hypothetical protein|uniref:DUF7860 family protein n=1 Tax=Halovenus marina TaxID=3396621 RepID=UPI003F567BA7